MTTDPLSDILKLVEATPAIVGGFTAGGEWAMRFRAQDKLKFICIVKGECWFCIDSTKEKIRISEGDVLLLSLCPSFVLASSPEGKPVEATEIFTDQRDKTVVIGDVAECIQIGGHISLNPTTGHFLTDVLPLYIHARSNAPQAAVLRWLLEQLILEKNGRQPGHFLATTQIIQLMLIQTLRLYLASGGDSSLGWLKAIRDKKLASVMNLMHSMPERRWTLENLARESAMSRTSFAVYFKSVVGAAPLTYLTRWRMLLAEKMLREEDVSIGSMAEALGYTSESGFSNAFKRTLGISPQHYRRTCKVNKEPREAGILRKTHQW